jgi:undecaprenyl diphosphate synthase
MELKEQIDKTRLPKHIAVIMDGNGRWARTQGEKRIFGHQHGVSAVRNTAEACAELGIQYLTLYAFSTENWSRPQVEVDALMELLVKTISGEMKTLMDNNIRLRAIGDLTSLPASCHNELNKAMDTTAKNTGLNLVLALSYSSRWEITKAVKDIADEVKKGKLEPASINEQTVSNHLATAGFPDPELLIRTSGELRISNFLLWQIAYTELYITSVLWPDFTKNDLYTAILNYQGRERRFGMTSEQVITK